MTLKVFNNLPEAERILLAEKVSETLKQFVSEGNSTTLSRRLTQRVHGTPVAVIYACCKIIGLDFRYLNRIRQRTLSFQSVACRGVDVLD